MPAAEQTVSELELARLLGVTRPAVTQWRQAGCPFRRARGRYEYVVSEVVDWRLARAREQQRDETAPVEALERARKLRAEADRAEFELAKVRGEHTPTALYTEELGDAFERVRTKLLAVPGEHAVRFPELGMREATRRLRAVVDQVLADLEAADDVPDDEHDQEAA